MGEFIDWRRFLANHRDHRYLDHKVKIRTLDKTRMLAKPREITCMVESKMKVGRIPAGRDVKDEGSNNVVYKDRGTPGTNSLETTRLSFSGRNGHRIQELRRSLRLHVSALIIL